MAVTFYKSHLDFDTGFKQDQDGIPILRENCLQTCMTYTIAECTVNKLPMTDGGTV